jgi:outer membrane protein, heavy metal efflux system
MNRFLPTLLALLPAVALAGEAPAPADLGALLREADEKSPVLRAASARLEASRRVPSQVRALSDPEVDISYTNDGVSRITLGEREFSNLALTWRQEVPYPGKRAQAGEVAEESARISEAELERVRLEVASAVKSAYADLYRLDRTVAVLDETRLALESLAESARRRYEVGEGNQESVLKAQTEILRLEAEMARVSGDRQGVEARLNATLGRAEDESIGAAVTLPGVEPPEDAKALEEEAAAASPSVAGLQAAGRRAEARARLAQLNLKPDFIWSGSYVNRDGLDPMVMGMFGLRLPIYKEKKQRQAWLEARSESTAAQQDLADLQLRTRAQVRDLIARFQRADRLVTLYGQGVVPQARSALESARTSYGVGRLPFLDLLNDQVVVLEARIQLASEESERLRVLAALEQLLARELIRVPAAHAAKAAGAPADAHDRDRRLP